MAKPEKSTPSRVLKSKKSSVLLLSSAMALLGFYQSTTHLLNIIVSSHKVAVWGNPEPNLFSGTEPWDPLKSWTACPCNQTKEGLVGKGPGKECITSLPSWPPTLRRTLIPSSPSQLGSPSFQQITTLPGVGLFTLPLHSFSSSMPSAIVQPSLASSGTV